MLQMNDSLIVSDELKEVIDSENIYGLGNGNEIPLTIWMDTCIIHTSLAGAKYSSERIQLEFKTTPSLSQELLVNPNINELMIGDETKNKTIKKCKIKTLSVTASEDMYFCRISIDSGK